MGLVPIENFVQLCLAQRGKPYIFAAQPSPSEPNPGAFDCSGLVRWASGRAGVPLPAGSWIQAAYLRDHGTLLPINTAINTRGALLFMGPNNAYSGVGPSGHVAVSLGDGSTIEARGRAYGTGSWGAWGRAWSNAGYIPGYAYQGGQPVTPPRPALDPGVDWHALGKYLRGVSQAKIKDGPILQQGSRGTEVSDWQTALNLAVGSTLVVDGSFGPGTDRITRDLQTVFKLGVDGVVGPKTRAACVWALASHPY